MTRKERRVKPAYKITETGQYLLKLGSMPADPKRPGSGIECEKGWTDYQFDYDSEIIARTIQQWAETQSVETEYTDGFAERGIWTRHMNQLPTEDYTDLEWYQNISTMHVLAVIQPILLVYDK